MEHRRVEHTPVPAGPRRSGGVASAVAGVAHQAGAGMRTPARSRLLLGLLCTAQFLVVLDMTIVNVALPAIASDLDLPDHGAHWVMTAYAVTFGGFLLAGGRAADAFGRRRALVSGAALFTAASLACGLATSEAILLPARAAQGAGGAFLSTSAFGILVATFAEGGSRTRAIAAWGSVASLGAVSGFVAGGILTELLGWRAVFLAGVPAGLFLVAGAPRLLPASRPAAGVVVDLTGATLATLGVGATAFVVTSAQATGWGDGRLVAAGGVAALALAAFARRERRARQPLLPRALLRSRPFAAAGLAGIAYGTSMLAILMLLAAYLQVGRGLSPLQAGALMLFLRAPAVGWARVAGPLVARHGAQVVLPMGTALMAAGVLLLARIPADGALAPRLLPALLVLGVAVPTVAVAVPAMALGSVATDDAAAGSGLLTTFQWVGGALGFALMSAIAGSPLGAATPQAIAGAAQKGFLACAALLLVASAANVGGLVRARTAAAVAHC